MQAVDLVVIGGGVVGTATAMALLERYPGLQLMLLEKEMRLAAHQSGHNSGVIHSGLYYRPGSFKAATCITGREAMYRFCAERGIPHRQCGKVVVATRPEEVPALEALQRRGREHGLAGLEWLDSAGLRRHEPHLSGLCGLHVPQTGIVDYTLVTEALADVVRSYGGVVLTGTAVKGIRRQAAGFVLQTSRGPLPCRYLITCAGLQSDVLARLSGLDPALRIIPFRGEYYLIDPTRSDLVRNLIYPVPDPRLPFLGVHFTRMINGHLEAGPNAVLALKREGYQRWSISVSDLLTMLAFRGFRRLAGRYWRVGLQEYRRSFSRKIFLRDLRRLVPELHETDLLPGGAGVRAQAVDADGNLLDDFCLVKEDNMLHLLNAPSPAATASISIGRRIAADAAEMLSSR